MKTVLGFRSLFFLDVAGLGLYVLALTLSFSAARNEQEEMEEKREIKRRLTRKVSPERRRRCDLTPAMEAFRGGKPLDRRR